MELVTEDQLDAMIKAGTPVVVDWYATWCGPCKSFTPRLEKFSPNFESAGIKVVKADIEKFDRLADHIEGVPTLEFYLRGERAHQEVGALSNGDLKEYLSACSELMKKEDKS
jgi:thioredoxin 1